MVETIGEDGVRIRFHTQRIGPRHPSTDGAALQLAEALRAMEEAGCCPVLDDGLSAGNAALRLDDGTLLVSPSGRHPGEVDPRRMVQLVSFDAGAWSATVRSLDDDTRPTSDSPLHWAALVEAARRFGWPARPGAALHGHVLETDRAAAVLGLPLSPAETLFSTPPDRDALLALLERAPYPAHRTVIRRGHGFFTLGPDATTVASDVVSLAERARSHGLLPG